MKRLTFQVLNEIFVILIKEREIFYFDRNVKNGIRIIPPDENLVKKVITSRNKFPSWIADFYYLTKKEKEEYENAKDEDELAKICIEDCISKCGARLIKNETS